VTDVLRCGNCGSTNIDELEPLDTGLTYCGGCDRVTNPRDTPRPRYEPQPRPRRDTDE
jgi:hypothetical protein